MLKVNFGLKSYPTYNDAGNLFPRKGELREGSFVYKYQFHGKGCTVMKNEIWISYNIDILNNNEISITAWNVKKIIETYTGQSSEYKSNEIDQAFIELEKKKVLVRRKPDFMVFNIIDF